MSEMLLNDARIEDSIEKQIKYKSEEVEVPEKKIKLKVCFIVTPIGPEGSEIRRATDGVIDSVLEPILLEFNYICKVAHRVNGQGLITSEVINDIVESDLVIANLTGLNPNVMYELALRHCTDKPIIHICDKNTILPFDIKDQRMIMYKNDMYGAVELKNILKNEIKEIEKNYKQNSNIITFTRKQKILIDSIENKDESHALQIILDAINQKIDRGTKVIRKLTVPEICIKYNILDTKNTYWYYIIDEGNKFDGDKFIFESMKLYPERNLSFVNLDKEGVIYLSAIISIEDRLKIDKIALKNGYCLAGR